MTEYMLQQSFKILLHLFKFVLTNVIMQVKLLELIAVSENFENFI